MALAELARPVRAQLLHGHVLDVLRSLEANTFQCVATSPPYYGLRDYGLPPQVWGGEPGHEHEWGVPTIRRLQDGTVSPKQATHRGNNGSGFETSDCSCACGAVQCSLGLEPTPELYVEHLTSVFRELRRVLRPDGVCWVNLGDSYAGSGKGPSGNFQPEASCIGQAVKRGTTSQFNSRSVATHQLGDTRVDGCKPKDLLGMPWMVAFALRADGWYLRADIIWSKPNPMPESVTDRPTKAHEYVFLLSKSRTYFYDADAIREPAEYGFSPTVLRDSDTRGFDHDRKSSRTVKPGDGSGGRNRRSVWEIATAPFPEAHFATWPPKLVEPMLLAGSRPSDLVLDPFGGSCTTALVAARLGRDSVSIDLNPDYLAMGGRRILADCPLFVEVC